MAEKSNKLSIYMLKPGTSVADALKREYTPVELDDGVFYYDPSHTNPPGWLAKFFGASLAGVPLLNSSSKGVYVTQVEFGEETRTFVLPFGYGHSMIDKAYCVDDFGLKLILNTVDRNSIRKIGKRTLSSDPKNTIEQLSKVGAISDFGIDIEQDLIEEITGKPKAALEEKFGKNLVTGKVAFTTTMRLDISDIEGFLKTCKENYDKDDYKTDFEFIDQVKEIKDAGSLNNTLVQKLKDPDLENVQVWMAIPEIIDWVDVEGFTFGRKKENLLADISLKDFKDTLTAEQLNGLDLNVLRRKKVTAFRAATDDEYNSWTVYQCMYCEITEVNRTVILTNGKWYEIAKGFVDTVNTSYADIMAASAAVTLINANPGEHEDAYNTRLAGSIANAVLMDRKNVSYGGGASSIEFCDIYDSDNRRFIHVKNYYGSSALSHLFAQGRVSGQLFLNDKPFRVKVKEKEGTLPFDVDVAPKASDYKVVFGVISDSTNDLNLPFFSKVNLKNEKKLLEAFGFSEIYLTKIQRT